MKHVLLLLLLPLISCDNNSDSLQTTVVDVDSLIDPSIPEAVSGNAEWGYSKTASVDLNADGGNETIVVHAMVETFNNEPLWDDNNLWQVYIKDGSSEITYIYSKAVQLGHVEVLVNNPGENGQNSFLLLERTPYIFSIWEVRYSGSGNVNINKVLARETNPAVWQNP